MAEKKRILIVEDELDFAKMVKLRLESIGYDVSLAGNTQEGTQRILEEHWDLMVLDLMMPGISGLELVQLIKEKDAEVITIIITGYATLENAVDAMKKGAYDYVPKPFTPDELLVVVKRGLEKRGLTIEAASLEEERQRNLTALTTEQSKLKTIIGCMADGVLVINIEKQLVLWNPAAEKMLKPEVLSREIHTYDKVIKNVQLINLINSSFFNTGNDFGVITRELELQEEGIILMANLAWVIDDTSDKLGIVVVLRDITQLKELERVKSQFVNMVAHELKAPLAAIGGYLDVLLEGTVEDDPVAVKKMQQRAKMRTQSLLDMVNDLLHLSILKAGKIKQNKKNINVEDVIEKSLEIIQAGSKEKNISLQISIDNNIPKISADGEELERVFTNLIENAFKYNKKNGTVLVKVHAEDMYIIIDIADTGIGIKENELEKIFDEFYRIKNEETRYITGTGLGLSIVKKIIDSHYGYIDVKSRSGEGTNFIIKLPIHGTN